MREKITIVVLMILMIIKGVLWSAAFPLWQGPDEDDHYAVIQFIAETRRLPGVGDEVLPDEVALSRGLADVGRVPYAPEQRQAFSNSSIGPNEAAFADLDPNLRRTFERGDVGKLMHATPLYYVMAAPVYWWSSDGDLLFRAHVQRLLAVLIGSPIVIVAYLITRRLFPNEDDTFHQAMRLTIPILVAFHPMITEITAVVSVDGLLILCYSLLILLTIDVLQKGLSWGNSIWIGVVFTIGVLTKPTLNGFAPLVALVIFYDYWRSPARRPAIFKAAVLMNAIIIPPLIWWMQRSWRLNQDLFYFNPILKGHRIINNPLYDYGIWDHTVDYYGSIWGGMFATWWAHFGWLDTPVQPWVYHLLRLLTVLAIVGCLYRLLNHFRKPIAADQLISWGFLALTIAVPVIMLQIYDLTFWWDFGVGRGMQGRYWLGTVVPMLSFFVIGLLFLIPKRWHLLTHHVLRIGIVIFNFASLLAFILPRYYL
ncbi:MAG: glycosyltransferase family 39 protein [Ardenticatenaceae bacterium]|nr:glycosyltransferase family 39 protein [Ardenticatenaceae bacterium]